MALTLTLREPADVPLEVEGITPDTCQGRTVAEIENMPLYVGNRQVPLAEFFQVDGHLDDARMDWHGDLSGVHWIGAKMAAGHIEIADTAGRHVGSEMSGGSIHVQGDAGDWVGGEMRGGQIHVQGRAGHLVGAAYRGSRLGMKGGTILIHGDAGNEIGHTMRRGMICVGGNCGDLAGFNMAAGTILVFGECGIRHGAGMRRGTIGLLGTERPDLLPTFQRACLFEPLAVQLIWRDLSRRKFPVPDRLRNTRLELYHGDLIEGGRGEIMLCST